MLVQTLISKLAVEALNEGLTPWEVQSYIGHRSLVMTCNTYGHRYPGASRVDEALAKFLPMTTG